MSDSTNIPWTTESATANVFHDGEALVAEFQRLIASELTLLTSGQVDGLESVIAAKQEIIEKLDTAQEGLIALFEKHHEQSEVRQLMNRFQQCRIDNRSNHALVMLELKHTNRSLDMLRSVLDMDDLSLYSERGEVNVLREKRRIGSA